MEQIIGVIVFYAVTFTVFAFIVRAIDRLKKEKEK